MTESHHLSEELPKRRCDSDGLVADVVRLSGSDPLAGTKSPQTSEPVR